MGLAEATGPHGGHHQRLARPTPVEPLNLGAAFAVGFTDAAADVGIWAGAGVALLTLWGLLWVGTGGQRRWRERRDRDRALRGFWERFAKAWEGEPASPGFERRPGLGEVILETQEALKHTARTAKAASMRGIRHEQVLRFLLHELREVREALALPHHDPPSLIDEDERP